MYNHQEFKLQNVLDKTMPKPYWKRYKLYLLAVVKIICFVILVLSGVSVTLEYLSYPYIYKLIVSDNKNGFDLPPISVCTERNVFFDKHKVIQTFGLQQEYEEWRVKSVEKYNLAYDKCLKEIDEENAKFVYKIMGKTVCTYLRNEFNYNMSLFFKPHETMIFESLTFDQMKDLMVSTEELFKCSAKLHFRYDSKLSNITNCFERFEVLESIYGNEFGICYTFFAKNYSILLKDSDYIEFDINYETQQKFMINGFYDIRPMLLKERFGYQNSYKENIGLYFDDYFGLYFSVNPKHKEMFASFETSFKSTRNSLNSELRISKTSVELLSSPYMEKCKHYGQ